MKSSHRGSNGCTGYCLATLAFVLAMRGGWCQAATLTMTFDSIAEGTAFARNAVREENGIRAVCHSDYSSFADPLNGFATTPLYFHGTGHYIEFSLVSGGTFDLISFWLTSNGYASRWVETSKTAGQIGIPGYTSPTLISFTNAEYRGITWFRIGTPWYATEVDSVTVDEGVIDSPPASFELQSPTQGAEIYTTSPTLDWGSAAGAVSYELFLGESDPPSSYGMVAASNSQAVVAGLQEHTTYHWHVVASNQFGFSRAPESGSWSFATMENSVYVTSNAVIHAGDATYDGQNIVVDGCTLTVNGSHSFTNLRLINGAKVTHSAATTDTVYSVDLAVGGTLMVSSNSSIDASGKGYLPGRTMGNTATNASIENSGGSYGGLGGRGVDGMVNPVYGDFRCPDEPGSGAGTAGGGLIRITAGALALDGVISANGLDGTKGQGSGGGIRLNVGVLSGSGQIKADGGGLSTSWGGGGGGRIAIYYEQLDGFDVSTRISVAGGLGNADNKSAPGTLYLKKAGERGQLVIDRKAGATGTAWLWVPEGTNYAEEVVLRGAGTTAEVWSASLTPSDMYLTGGATLTHAAATATNEPRLELNVLGTLSISSNSAIDVCGKGYLAGRTWPNATAGASTSYSGGSYGGWGGRSGTDDVNAVYGDFRNPNELGSGGGTVKQGNQAGGGLVRIKAGTLVLDGGILASGVNGYYGRGSGGGILLDVGTLSGAGQITAQGGSAASYVPHGGGGGRIAIYYEQLDGFDVSSRISAAGGQGSSQDGAPGSIYLQQSGNAGQLVMDRKGGGSKAGWVWLPEGATNYQGEVILQGAGTTAEVWSASVAPANLHLMDGAVLTHRAATTNQEYRLELNVAGTLHVSSGSKIDVSARGYMAGRTVGNSTNGAATGFAGGSYGGFGSDGGANSYMGVAAAPANMVYGDFRDPNEPGSGAGRLGAGGGLVRITAGTLELDGLIAADGQYAGYYSGGGSGGGIRLDVGILSGEGLIRSRGGAAYPSDQLAGGGGGRIAIFYEELIGFDLTSRVDVGGGDGTGSLDGSSGTVYLKKQGESGELVLDSRAFVNSRPIPLWLPSGASYRENIVVQGTGTVAALWTESLYPSNVRIRCGGVLTHPAATATQVYGLNLAVSGTLHVDSNSAIDVSCKGYLPGRTHPNSADGATAGTSGASYGGLGQGYSGNFVNDVYGDYRNPSECGSGSGAYGGGVSGGGMVRITAGSFLLDGVISAGSSDGIWGRGSGGSIYLDVNEIAGAGAIWARGGNSTAYGGSGGGGRIAVYAAQSAGFDLASRVGAQGGTGAGPGTVYLVHSAAPAMFSSFQPTGYVAGVVSTLVLHVATPLVDGSMTLEDLQFLGPDGSAIGVADVVQTSLYEYQARLQEPAAADGAYTLRIGTGLQTIRGGTPAEVATHVFTIDNTPPVPPMITNYPGAPVTNWLRATSVTVLGNREGGSAVWRGSTRLIASGSGGWSNVLSLTQGLNVVALHARDAAGNRSETNSWLFTVDTVAPAVIAVIPANNAAVTSSPSFVRLTFSETTSGLDPQRSTFTVRKSGVAIPGGWVATTDTMTFTPEGSTLDGSYSVAATLVDQMNNTGTFSSVFTVDTTPPSTPILNPVTTPTTINQQPITGIRDPGTSTYVYRGESGSNYGSQSGGGTSWSYTVSLTNGWNYWGFTAVDSAGNQSPRTNVAIRYDNVAPGAVAVTGQVAGTGLQLTLGWSGYDEVANGNDIARYTIYQSGSPFAEASQAQAIGTNNAGNKAYVVTGLTRNETKYYAVVARDATGFADSNVTSVGLAPVDVVAPPNPTGAVFVCGGTDLAVRWSASANPHGDLAGYKVYATNEAEGAALPATTNEFLKTGLEESKAYSFRISACDVTGNEGAGLVVTGYTLLPNPIGLAIAPYDGFMSLSWQGVAPASNVGFYAIYSESGEYASVTGLVRRLTTTGTTAQVAGFANGATNWLAVTAVNRSGGENPAVAPVSAVTVDDVWGPELLNLKWQGGSAAGPATWPGRFTVQARDPIGVSRAEFRMNGTALSVEASGTTNFSAFWDVSQTAGDGPHELVVTGYDTKGNGTVVTQAVTVALALPPAPAITSPLGTTVVSRTWQSVSGTGAAYATAVRLYVNGACVATSAPSASGAFSATVNLQEGTNRIAAVAANRAGAGAASNPVSVVLDPSVPSAPAGLTASAQADGVIRLSWSDPTGVNIKGYHVYRANEPFAVPEQAARVNLSLVTTRAFSDLPSSDGTYHYRVSAVNQADTEGPLTAEASATSDRVAPKVVAALYSTDGVWMPSEGRFGRGTVTVELALSEGLQAAPFFSLNPVNGTPISVPLAKVSATGYRGSFAVTDASPCGAAHATFSGRDAAGNRGTEVQSGSMIALDVCGPVLSALSVTPAAPIQNSAAAPTTATVVALFAAGDVPVRAPSLKWSLSQTRTTETAVTMSPLTERSWTGDVALPATAGQAAEHLGFSYEGVDDLGNTGRVIATESRYEVYQGALPPLAAPEGLAGAARPGGEVALTWRAVPAAADYAVFRGPASNGVSFVARSGGATNHAEAAEDSTNWYAVASVREANGQTSTGALSAAVQVVADATAPDAPAGLALSLLGTGVKATWQAPGGEAVKYEAYRSGSDFSSTAGLAAKATNLSATTWTDPHPETGPAHYGVVAVDAAGNRSPVSARAYTNLALLPVNSLQVKRVSDGVPVVSWTHGQVSGITGYNLYAGEEGEETLLNGTLGSMATQHVDSSYSGGSRRYAIAAVDEQRGLEVESVRRGISLPDLRVSLPTNAVILRGVMNRLSYSVLNAGSTGVSGARLHAGFLGMTHPSEPFSLAAGAQATVPVVVGGYTNLGSRVVVTNRVELAPNAGEGVELTSTNELETGTGMLVAEILNGELARGTDGKVRFALHNTSSEEIEVVLAQGGNASPEVRLKLEDGDGMVFASVAAKQTLGDKVLTVANGQAVARIPAGESFTSAEVSLPIPTNAPNAVVLRLEIDRLHYHVGREDHVQIGGLQNTRAASLAETRYYAEVTNVTPAASFGDTNIWIQGRAVNRASGLAEQNAPVKLVVSVDGFERSYALYSDSAGTWSYSFSPLAGEAGTYRVWAVHPSVVAKPEQAGFSIARVGVSPAVANLSIPTAYVQTVPVTVTASRGNALTNVVMSCAAADQPGGTIPAGLNVAATARVDAVQGGQSATLPFRLWGDASAASTGQVSVRVSSDGAPAGGWGTVTVNYRLNEALPALQWTPNYVQTGVAIGNSQLETVVLKNAGYAAMEGVTLALLGTNGLAAPAWVRLNAPTNVGTLAVGEERAVTLAFAPTGGVSETRHEFRLRVRAQNHATKDINLFAGVDGSGLGGALFKVTDIYTGTSNQQGGIVQGLAGATLTLQKESGTMVVTSRVSDALGEASFRDLPVGSYVVRVTASRHDAFGGRIWVQPGMVTTKEVFLPYNLVTVEWTVVPITIEDRYEVVLTATFETDVPAPVVVIEPTSVALPDMKAGDVLNVEMRIVNHGLVRAENMVFAPPASDEHLRFELLTAVPATLEAKQVVTIPYRITCLKSLSGDGADAGGGGSAFCGTRCASASYDHTCPNGYRASGRSAGGCVTRACSGSSQVGLSGGGTVNFGLSGGGGGSSGSPGATSLPQGKLGCAPKIPCPPEDICCRLSRSETTHSMVDVVQGQYYDSHTDMSVPVLGHEVSLARAYRAGGWHFNVQELDLTRTNAGAGSGSLMAALSRGGMVYKQADQAGTIYANGAAIIFAETNGYRFVDENRSWWNYDQQGLLVDYGDRHNLRVGVVRDGANRINGFLDHYTNQVLWMTYDSTGRLTEARDRETNGRVVRYTYDGSGLLTNVTDALGNRTTYRYDAQKRLVFKRNPAGQESHLTYTSEGYLSSVLDANGQGKRFEYGYDAATGEYYAFIQTPVGAVVERWFDANGEEIRRSIDGQVAQSLQSGTGTVETDAQGRRIRYTRPDGLVQRWSYEDEFNLLKEFVGETGLRYVYEHDDNGNLIRKTDAAGTAEEEIVEYEYNEYGLPREYRVRGDTHLADAVTTYEYDSKGQIINKTDPEGFSLSRTYNQYGQVVTTTNPRGAIWSNTYNEAGYLMAISDPMGRVVSNAYDAFGRLSRVTEDDGRVTTYEYDVDGRIICTSNTLAGVSRYEYGPSGKVIRDEAANGTITTYSYDARGRLIGARTGENLLQTYEYDEQDRLSRTVDPEGNETRWLFDDTTGQLVGIVYPSFAQRFVRDLQGNIVQDVWETEDGIVTNSYAYTVGGHRTEHVDGEGRRTSIQYNPRERVTAVIDPMGNATKFDLDRWGRVARLTDPGEQTNEWTYDRTGLPLRRTYADGSSEDYAWDAEGNLVREEDAMGRIQMQDYDPLGNVTNIRYYASGATSAPAMTARIYRDRQGRAVSYDDGAVTGRWSYDDTNRVQTFTLDYGPFAKSYSYAIDRHGRTTNLTYPDGLSVAYVYDDMNRLSSIGIPGVGPITYADYRFDLPTRIALPGGATLSRTYNGLLQPRENWVRDAANQTIWFASNTYNRVGNVTTQTTSEGVASYAYNQADWLTLQAHPQLGQTAYSYDAAGNRVGMTGSTNWIYNNLNQLTQAGGTAYEYDAAGARTRKVYGTNEVLYEYDAAGNLVALRDGQSNVVARYAYDPWGNRIRKEVGGVITYYLYGEDGLLAEFNAAGEMIRTYGYEPNAAWNKPIFMRENEQVGYYVSDHMGAPQKLVNGQGSVLWSAVQDAFGRAEVSPASTLSNPFRISSQYADDESGLHYNTHRYYDPEIGRYLTRDPLGEQGGVNLYRFAGNNPMNLSDLLGLKTILGIIDGTCAKEDNGNLYGGKGLGNNGKGDSLVRLKEHWNSTAAGALPIYSQGPGTRGFDPIITQPLDLIFGGVFGVGSKMIALQMYADIVANYEEGDTIMLAGWSRGGAIANEVAWLIYNKGIPDVKACAARKNATGNGGYLMRNGQPTDSRNFDPGCNEYFVKPRSKEKTVAQIHLLDPVYSMGIPGEQTFIQAWDPGWHKGDVAPNVDIAYVYKADYGKAGPPPFFQQPDWRGATVIDVPVSGQKNGHRDVAGAADYSTGMKVYNSMVESMNAGRDEANLLVSP